MGIGGRQRTSRPGLAQRLTIAKAIALLTVATPAMAQTIQPDNTLGNENSRVVRNVRIRGVESDRIEGGSRRGQNLFHSFTEFSIPEGRGAYFLNPDGVRNIFGRVTGGGPSGIFGTLGVVRLDGAIGNANLFLINPNGIRFGRTAHLDLGGSFMGTTANAIQFGNLGNFSVTDASPPSPVLTINPSAFLFSSVNRPADEGTITVNASQPAPWNPNSFGLQVADGQSLTLLGRGVTVDAAQLNAFGGRVNLAAINTGTVGLTENGSLLVPTAPRGDITITNGSVIDVSLSDRGDIALLGRNINVLGESTLSAGIFSRFSTASSQAGNILLNATDAIRISESRIENEVNLNAIGNSGNVDITADSLEIRNGSRLSAGTYGRGNAGDVRMNVRDRATIDGSVVVSNVGTGAVGNGGNVQITAGSLSILNGAALAASLRGQGNSGNVILNARDRIRMEDGAAFSNVESSGIGQGGTVQITTGSLEALNGTQLNTTTVGQGNAGNVRINARDRVTFSGSNADGLPSAAFSGVEPSNTGNRRGGNVEISAGALFVRNGAQLNADTLGRGNAGNVIINVRGQVLVENATIRSRVDKNAFGSSGNIQITTGSLLLTNGGQLISSTFGQGNAGNMIINARDRVSLEGRNEGASSAILSNVERTGRGQAGSIQITTGILTVENGGQLVSNTFRQGNAGNVIINARNGVTFDGEGSNLFSTVESEGVGNGGNIQITAGTLSITNAAQLTASTHGQGNAGNVTINARDRVSLENSSAISSTVESGAIGNGGSISINAGSLFITNQARLNASLLGQGNAGNIILNVRDRVSLDRAGIYSLVGETGEGNAGGIQITTGLLSLTNGATLSAQTGGQGNAGNVVIRASNGISLENSSIISGVNQGAVGNGGNIQLAANQLSLSNGSQLLTSTLGRGNAGNVTVNARNQVSLTDNSTISSTVESGAVGNSSNIDISARSLNLTNGSRISADTFGNGNAGNIKVQSEDTNLNNSSISTAVNSGAVGRGGDINLRARSLNLTNRAEVTASTSGQGNAGDITVRSMETVSLDNRSQISSAINRNAIGQGGTINIQTEVLTLGDRSQINSSSIGQGDTGRITIQASESIGLSDHSQISSQVRQNAVSNSQGITLNTPQLVLRGDAVISAATTGNGSAGDINIRNADRVSLSNSTLSTAVGSSGGTPDPIDPANLSTSRSRSASNQGDITIESRSLNLSNGSQITTNTAGRDNAGNVVIRDADITLSNSILSTEVTQPSTQQGGTIRLEGRSLTLDNARISASSQTEGNPGDLNLGLTEDLNSRNSQIRTNASGDYTSGGSIVLSANQINLTDSPITTTATGNNASGGSIRLMAETIRLRGNSDILTNVSSGAGNGGDITLAANAILAFDDSDILSSAPDQGGNITLDTSAFFGAGYPSGDPTIPDGNDRVDVNATGTVRNGTVTTPNTDLVQNNLGELPQTTFDAATQLQANRCIVRDPQTRLLRLRNRFIVTGGGGLPARPSNANLQTFPTGTIQTLPEQINSSWQPGEAIVEPQGVYQLPDGRLIMSRECPLGS